MKPATESLPDFMPVHLKRADATMLEYWRQCFMAARHYAVLDMQAGGVIVQMVFTWEEACRAAEDLRGIRARRKVNPIKPRYSPI